MTHEMKLADKPYLRMSLHTKTIELRLLDEKREKVHVGDEIIFVNKDDAEKKIFTRVIALHKYRNFDELYSDFASKGLVKKMGYMVGEKATPKDMEMYYTKDNQNKYGVVGIELCISHEVNHGFIYTDKNIHLREWGEELDRKRGRYLLYGPSGTGKTSYIKSICCEKEVCVFDSEQIKKFLREKLIDGIPYPKPDRDIIVIEYLDEFVGLDAHQIELMKLLEYWEEEKTLILCPVCRKSIVDGLRSKFEILSLQQTSLNPIMVRNIAEEKGVSLTDWQSEDLAKCHKLNSIYAEINAIKYKKEWGL